MLARRIDACQYILHEVAANARGLLPPGAVGTARGEGCRTARTGAARRCRSGTASAARTDPVAARRGGLCVPAHGAPRPVAADGQSPPEGAPRCRPARAGTAG